MKVVIDISENRLDALRMFYKDCQDNLSTSDIAIVEGKPLDNVLEEIRAEFKSKADGDDWYHTTDCLVWEEAIEIIDKYKEGESEEEKKHDKEATPTDATL